MRTLVVGYEGDDAAERALDRALEEARSDPAHLVVVAVAEMLLDPQALQTFGTLGDSPAPTIPNVPPPEIEDLFARARKRIEDAGVSADFVWDAGEPADAITAVARDRKADAVILGSHQHGLFKRVFGTDVASEVKRAAGCDVVVVD